MKTPTRLLAAALIGAIAAPAVAAEIKNPMVETPTWEVLRDDIVEQSFFLDGDNLMHIDVPDVAHNAAFVPFSIRQKRGTTDKITAMTIVVDENPAPVAARFEMGEMMGDLYLESRVRYDQPSNFRVIAETESGKSFMAGRWIQAAGGCAGTAPMDPSMALNDMGRMKLRQFETRASKPRSSGQKRQVQLMIKHPNFTGMQRMAGTQEIIDAQFVDNVEISLDGEMLLRMTGGFSISENPSFRFTYTDNGAQQMTVRATDTSGAVFQQVFDLAPQS